MLHSLHTLARAPAGDLSVMDAFLMLFSAWLLQGGHVTSLQRGLRTLARAPAGGLVGDGRLLDLITQGVQAGAAAASGGALHLACRLAGRLLRLQLSTAERICAQGTMSCHPSLS